jgi:two-component system cell cycle response regulator
MDVTQDIPVIVITCLDDVDSKIAGVKLGADDFLIKPINGRELKARIKVLLEKKGQLDMLRSHYEKALSSAIVDSLTGVYNHGYFKKFMGIEIKRSLRQRYPVSLIMLDIDDFKAYNDRLGHTVGDRILKDVGAVIRDVIREVDLTARYGGDEFAVILPYSDKAGAVKVARRIQETVSSFDFIKDGLAGEIKDLTLSIGVAEFPSDSDSESDLIEKADSMLYKAKNQGKNQIAVFGDPDSSGEHSRMEETHPET